jgi:hypothetical protein
VPTGALAYGPQQAHAFACAIADFRRRLQLFSRAADYERGPALLKLVHCTGRHCARCCGALWKRILEACAGFRLITVMQGRVRVVAAGSRVAGEAGLCWVSLAIVVCALWVALPPTAGAKASDRITFWVSPGQPSDEVAGIR